MCVALMGAAACFVTDLSAACFVTDLSLVSIFKLTHSSITHAKVQFGPQIKSTRWPQALPGDFLYPVGPTFAICVLAIPNRPCPSPSPPCRPPHPINQSLPGFELCTSNLVRLRALDGSRWRFGCWDLCLALPLT